MPFVRFHPVSLPTLSDHLADFPTRRSDPFADFLAAALAAEGVQQPAAGQNAHKASNQKYTTSSCAGPCNPHFRGRVVKSVVTPRFDVSETEDSYVLEGELPGVSNKSSISVSFDDAQTVVVKGEITRVRRSFKNTKKEEEQLTQEKQELTEEALQAAAAVTSITATATPEEETVVYDDDASSIKSKPKPVTVEDEVDESETASNASFEVVDGPTKADKGKAPAKDTDVEMTEAAEKPAAPATTAAKCGKIACSPRAKYWIGERSVGVFERKFKFQGLIDQDNVRASLENGLLTIVVPKREAFVRSILIN